LAVGLGLLTMLAFAPWKHIIKGSPERRELRRITRLLRDFELDHKRVKLNELANDREDDIGAVRRALHDTLSDAVTNRLEVRRLRRTMDDSIRKETDRATGRLLRQAHTDHLTGLGNRRGFEEQLGLLSAEAGRKGQPMAVLAIDMDHFKAVNDLLGHDAGDKCLTALGELLRGGLRGGDMAFRLGGDEFIVLMPGATAAVGQRVAERMSKLFGQITWPYDKPSRPTLSVGVASAPATALDHPDELVRLADEAMYSAKRTGRGRVVSRADTGNRAA
jgi:two-component system cell cycle response regulator